MESNYFCGDSEQPKLIRCDMDQPITFQSLIQAVKQNKYMPPLSEICILHFETGQQYTLDEINKILNN